MCYAKPGPRCHGHAVERKENIATKTGKAFREAENASDVVHKLEAENRSGYKDDPKYQKAKQVADEKRAKYNELSNKLDSATKDIDYTRGGIQELRDKLADCQPEKGVDEQMRMASLEKRLNAAEKVYDEQMLAYDTIHKTVNGRQGSPYGSEKGIRILRNKLNAVGSKLDAAYDNNDSEAFMKYGKKRRELKAQLDHAVATRRRVEAGIYDESRASLAENQEELKRVTNAYRRAEAGYDKNQQALMDGPMKEYNDYRRELARTGRTESRWRVGEKKRMEELKDNISEFRKQKVNPFYNAVTDLRHRKGVLESKIIWGKASEEKREKMLRSYREIQADYGKGPGSWTGD